MPPSAVSAIPIGLRSITIENFRGIDHLELKFLDARGNPSDLVVLGGPNGGGKTAVLEACLLAVGRSDLVLGPTDAYAIRSGAADYTISARLHDFDNEYVTEYRSVEGFWRGRNETTGQEGGPGRVECLYFSSRRGSRLVGAVPITAGQSGIFPRDEEPDRLRLVKQYLVNAKAHAYMRTEKLPAPNGSSFEASIQKLNEVWQTFHAEEKQRFTVEPVADDPEAGFDAFLTYPDGRRIPLDSLSSGQLELFTLFGSLIRLRFEQGLVVVDEPELHLDSQWHAPLLRALRRFLPGTQFLVATQSPEVYDSAFSWQRHYLIPPGDPREIAWGAELAREES